MRTEIKNLHEQQKSAVAEYERLLKEQASIQARIADMDKLAATLQPTLAAGDSLEELLTFRVKESERQARRQALADLRAEQETRLAVLKHAIQEARLAANRYAGQAWDALAESLMVEHAAVLKPLVAICEKAQFPWRRVFAEYPDLTPEEIAEIERREAFPQWL